MSQTAPAKNQPNHSTPLIEASLRLGFGTQLNAQNEFQLDVKLQIFQPGVTAIVGPSGCGKTTLLRAIAGLQPCEGTICINGQYWQQDKSCQPVHQRNIGYVFQEASLFPHLTVEQNIHFGIKRAKKNRQLSTPTADIAHFTKLLGIDHLMQRYPEQLSGGQQQRVAIARAVLTKPDLLLMDEPLAALDHSKKQEILGWLEQLKQELSIPVLYVTHSQEEVARLADYVVLMENGKIKQQGDLKSVFSSLNMPAGFTDEPGVIIEATVTEIDDNYHLMKASFEGGEFWLQQSDVSLNSKIRLRVLARDVSLALGKNSDSSILNVLNATVSDIKTNSDSPIALVKLSVGSETLIARITRRSLEQLDIVPGKKIWAQVKSVALVR